MKEHQHDPDWWEVLGVDREATVEDVRTAYDTHMDVWKQGARENASLFYRIKGAWEKFSEERNHGLPPELRYDPVLDRVTGVRAGR